MDPIDYLGLMGGLGPSYNDTIQQQQVIQQNSNILAQQKAAQAAAVIAKQKADAQAQAYSDAVAEANRNPTAANWARLQVLNPDAHEAIKNGWEMLDKDKQGATLRDTASLYGYLKAGKPEAAKAHLQQRIDADKAAGQDTGHDQQILDLIGEDPNAALNVVAPILASIAGPEKMADAYGKIGENARADELQPGLVAKGVADASKATTEAAMAPKVIASDLATEAAQREKVHADIAYNIGQLAVARGRLDFDKDKAAADTYIRTQEIQQKYGQMQPATQKIVNDSVASASVNYGLANRAKDLADQMQVSDMRGAGWRSWFGEKMKGSFGSQDAVTGLRNSYNMLVNSQAVRNLPPGPASDKDIEMAKQGFPPPDADKAHIVSFLRGMEKMQRLAAEVDDRRADWAGANQGLGPARQDMEVGGYLVKKGTRFNQFNNAIGALSKGPPAAILDLESKVGR